MAGELTFETSHQSLSPDQATVLFDFSASKEAEDVIAMLQEDEVCICMYV